MKKYHILVAEDDTELLKVITLLLKSRGYYTYAVKEGKKAWQILSSKSVDLAILDIKMPGIDGLTLVKKIKSTSSLKSIPVIIITGVTRTSGKSDDYWTIRVGADDFITKPFEPQDLLKRIEEQLKIYEE
ncbi:response regulator transcription factor [Candidatus Calescamantes bacterium]|nr:response regulator transcription factor [Candidatus Calescamantes bacterium]